MQYCGEIMCSGGINTWLGNKQHSSTKLNAKKTKKIDKISIIHN